MNITSIQGKIAIVAGGCLLGSAVALVTYSVGSEHRTQNLVASRVSKLTQATNAESLKNLAWAHAGVIQAKFDLALDAARTMAHTFELTKTGAGGVRLGRGEINSILRNVLVNNTEFNGTYSCWEPNALDGADAEFRTGQDGNNAVTGRFTPYWNRGEDGRIAVQSLVEYDTMDRHPNGVLKGGWYIGPRETHTESVLDPFPYIVQGKQVWLTTLSVPIMVNGKFYGVAGTDYNLDFVQKLAEKADRELFDGRGQVTIVSYAGLVVADSEHPDLIGKALASGSGVEDAKALVADVQAGKSRSWTDESTGTMNAVAPIALGRTGKPWAVLVHVPTDVVLAQAHALDAEIKDRGASATLWQILVGLGVTAAATAVLWIAAGGIARPIRAAAEFARTIRMGDFSKRIRHDSQDEVGQLAHALDEMSQSLLAKAKLAERISEGDLDVEVDLASDNDQLGRALRRMVDSLNDLVGELQAGAAQISGSAGQVAELSEVLSEGAYRSAQTVTQISAATSQIGAQTQNNADNAGEANGSSRESRDAASLGAQQMDELMGAMDEIRTAGERINDIINAIDEITTQTNLLALNAAIEAARAGETGRGFAVVADEVRKLAVRSADAASQAAKLIGESGQKTQRGVEIATRTAESLNVIVSSASRVSTLVADIATASQEQAASIQEVTVGLSEIDGVTQRTSGHAVDCTEAAKALTAQAQHMNTLIGRFKVKRRNVGRV